MSEVAVPPRRGNSLICAPPCAPFLLRSPPITIRRPAAKATPSDEPGVFRGAIAGSNGKRVPRQHTRRSNRRLTVSRC